MIGKDVREVKKHRKQVHFSFKDPIETLIGNFQEKRQISTYLNVHNFGMGSLISKI